MPNESARTPRIGKRFAEAAPFLGLSRGCRSAMHIIKKMDYLGFRCEERADSLALEVIGECLSAGLAELGEDRKSQRSAIAKLIVSTVANAREISEPIYPSPLSFRSSDARSDATIATVHHNSEGYRRLCETFREWLPTLPQKPICCELVFDDDEPEIEGSIVIRGTRAANLMWQKEPLLNILLARCTTPYFVWSDHDIVWQNPNWLSKAINLLNDETHAVQLFRRFIRPEQSGEKKITNGVTSGGPAPGGAWMAKTEWLKKIGGFPVHKIVGSGDTDMFRKMQPHTTFIDADVIHLWHGDKKYRQHHTRMDILRRHNYRHGKDTRINDDGILEWCSDKPGLHADVRAFFEGRREDG